MRTFFRSFVTIIIYSDDGTTEEDCLDALGARRPLTFTLSLPLYLGNFICTFVVIRLDRMRVHGRGQDLRLRSRGKFPTFSLSSQVIFVFFPDTADRIAHLNCPHFAVPAFGIDTLVVLYSFPGTTDQQRA